MAFKNGAQCIRDPRRTLGELRLNFRFASHVLDLDIAQGIDNEKKTGFRAQS